MAGIRLLGPGPEPQPACGVVTPASETGWDEELIPTATAATAGIVATARLRYRFRRKYR